MDISYLLWLQDLREATGGMFDEIFNAITKFAIDILPFLSFVIFWCVDKKWGYRFMATYGISEVVNNLVKLTVCAYRPWIRSDLIEPAGDSKVAATGYSFPSGHTQKATVMYGTIAVWQGKKRRWLAIFCIVMIALTMISRNYLGVHTPQDVLVGCAESVIIIFLVGFAQKKIDGDNKKLDILSIIGILLIVGALLYMMLKPYPMDYVDGELLVDPQKMMDNGFKACGILMGFILGSFIERHFVRYEIPKGAKNLGLLVFVGFMIAFAWKEYFAPATVVALFGNHWGNYIARIILWIFAIAIWPIFIRKWAKEGDVEG